MIGTPVIIMSYANTDPELCLSVNPNDNASIIVVDAATKNLHQLWAMIDAGGGNLAFWNYGTESLLILQGPDGQLGLRAALPIPGMSYANDEVWTMAPCRPTANWWAIALAPFTYYATLPFAINLPHSGLAIRPSTDSDRNLNILGNGPYNPGSAVAAWDGWGGGDSNEVWMPVTV